MLKDLNEWPIKLWNVKTTFNQSYMYTDHVVEQIVLPVALE